MWNESPNNPGVPIEKTVRDLFELCDRLRGEDGATNTPVRIGLLRRIADHFEMDFEKSHGFVKRRGF